MKQRVIALISCFVIALLIIFPRYQIGIHLPESIIDLNQNSINSNIMSEHDLIIHVMEEEFVMDTQPDENFHENPVLHGLVVGMDSADNLGRAFIKFNLGNIPDNIRFSYARFYSYLTRDFTIDGTDVPIGVYYCADDTWNESTITWNNQPEFSSSPSSVIDSPTSPNMFEEGNWYGWDVTSLATMVLTEDKMLSLVMRNVEEVGPANTKIFAEEEDEPLNSSYLQLHCYTPSVVDIAIDDIAEGPLLEYIQNQHPTFSWSTSDTDALDFQNDYQIEMYENIGLNDIIWQSRHTDRICILNNGTDTNTLPFGTMNEMRFQYKYMSSILNHSGIIDKIYFGINNTETTITLSNLVISMSNTLEPGSLGFDFGLNIGESTLIEVLRADSYTAPIINNTIEFDVENIFFSNHQMNLIIEIRYTTSSSIATQSFYNSAIEYGSTAYAWGPGAYYSAFATTLEAFAYDVEIEFSTDAVLSNSSLSQIEEFGFASDSSGILQMKFNSSLLQDSGYIDRIYIHANESTQNVILENLKVTLAETTVEGPLDHENLNNNYASENSMLVLTNSNYTLHNIDGFLILDVLDNFYYSGTNNLLIELEWDSQIGDIGGYILNNSGGYSAWSYGDSDPETNNATWAYSVSLDFVYSEKSIVYDGPPLMQEQEYTFMIRVCDITGIWSEWSDLSFTYQPLTSSPEWEGPIIVPSPVPLGSEVEVLINVTYFLGVNQVLIEYDGSNHSMNENGITYQHTWTPMRAEIVNFTIFMESIVGTWSFVDGSFEVLGEELQSDPLFLVVIGVGGLAACLLVAIVVRKRRNR